MDTLYDSVSILEALYDLHSTQETLLEEVGIVRHNYKKTGDVEMLTEGVGDIITLIFSSIKKFIQKMKDFIVRKFLILNSYRMEYDKLIEKYGKTLAAAKFVPFTIEGYRFTTLSRPRPNTGKVISIIDDFNTTIAKFQSLTMEDIRRINNEECSAVAFQRLRADVLGTTNRLSQEEFKKSCFMHYRNDQEFPEKITVDTTLINALLDGANALIAEKKIVKADKDTALSILNNMERFFSVKVSTLYDDIRKTYNLHGLSKTGVADDSVQTMGEKELEKLTMYLSSRYQQVVELTSIISIVFVERMAAINDQTNQELQILREVLKLQTNYVADSTDLLLETVNSFPPTPNPNWAPVWDGISDMGGGFR